MDVIAKVDEEPMDDPMPEKMEKPEEATKEGAPGTAVAQTSAVKLKVGSFRDQDSFHKGSGQGTIYRALDGSLLLRLEDFKVTNGPDLHVFLSPHPNPGKRDEVKATGYVDLGKLKGNRGNQNYPIPDEVNLAAIESIVIYCVPFHVIFSVASLETVVESLEALVPPPEAEEEEFPRASTAIVPPDMEREEVEKVMDIMAKVDQEPMDDPMPEEMAVEIVVEETVSKTTPVAPTPISTPTSVPTATPTPVGQADQPVEPSPTPAPAATPTPQPSPVTAAQGGAVKLKTGDFHDQDAFHKGSGQATIYRGPDGEHLLRLENLDVTNGPDLHVILTPNRDPKSQGDVKNTGWVDLGKLKGNRGNQNYPIPDDVDIAIQGSVVIYCKPFHVIFSVAPLEDVN